MIFSTDKNNDDRKFVLLKTSEWFLIRDIINDSTYLLSNFLEEYNEFLNDSSYKNVKLFLQTKDNLTRDIIVKIMLLNNKIINHLSSSVDMKSAISISLNEEEKKLVLDLIKLSIEEDLEELKSILHVNNNDDYDYLIQTLYMKYKLKDKITKIV